MIVVHNNHLFWGKPKVKLKACQNFRTWEIIILEKEKKFFGGMDGSFLFFNFSPGICCFVPFGCECECAEGGSCVVVAANKKVTVRELSGGSTCEQRGDSLLRGEFSLCFMHPCLHRLDIAGNWHKMHCNVLQTKIEKLHEIPAGSLNLELNETDTAKKIQKWASLNVEVWRNPGKKNCCGHFLKKKLACWKYFVVEFEYFLGVLDEKLVAFENGAQNYGQWGSKVEKFLGFGHLLQEPEKDGGVCYDEQGWAGDWKVN